MKYKAVFFDLDGTLMDTSEGVYAGGLHAMQTLGLNVSNPDWERFIGPPIGDCFKFTFGIQDYETQMRLADEYHKYYHKEGLYKAKYYPEIEDVLITLKAKGYKLGISSMKSEIMVKEMASFYGFDKYFDVLRGLDPQGKKTKASLLRDSFEILKVQPKDCVLVGDTIYDVKGATEAGCDYIKVNWGFGFKSDEPNSISKAPQILELVQLSCVKSLKAFFKTDTCLFKILCI